MDSPSPSPVPHRTETLLCGEVARAEVFQAILISLLWVDLACTLYILQWAMGMLALVYVSSDHLSVAFVKVKMDHLSVALLEGIVSDLDALQFCHLPEQLQKLSRDAEIFQIVCLLSHQSLMKGRSAFFPDCRRKDELRKVSSLGIAGRPATSKFLCSIYNKNAGVPAT